jgi:hypothetical protein
MMSGMALTRSGFFCGSGRIYCISIFPRSLCTSQVSGTPIGCTDETESIFSGDVIAGESPLALSSSIDDESVDCASPTTASSRARERGFGSLLVCRGSLQGGERKSALWLLENPPYKAGPRPIPQSPVYPR